MYVVRTIRCLALLLLVTSCCRHVWSASPEPPRPIKQFIHTSWSEASGLTGSVFALAQTKDGFLWIGTSTGLYRFDGMTFEPYLSGPNTQPIVEVRALLATTDGGVWIAHRTGIAFLKNGYLQRYTEKDGLPYGRARNLVQTKDGTIWATSVGGFVRFTDGRWERIREGWNYPEKTASELVVCNDGMLWAAGELGIYYLRAGDHTFHPSGLNGSDLVYMHAAADSSVWIAEPRITRMIHASLDGSGDSVNTLTTVSVSTFDFMIEKGGALWLSTPPGIARATPEVLAAASSTGKPLTSTDTFLKADGLSSTSARRFLEDREGNIWVGTDNGLDRFRRRSVLQMEFGYIPEGLIFGPHSEVWSTPNNTDYLNPVHQSAPLLITHHTEHFQINCEYMDEKGTLWLGMQSSPDSQTRALWRVEHGKAQIIPPPANMKAPFIKGIVSDGHGKLWMTVSGEGEYTWKDGVWERISVFIGKDADLSPDAEFVDNQGRGWLIYYARGVVVMVDGTSRRFFTAGHGIDLGLPIVGWASGTQVWITGTEGVAAFDGERFHTIQAADQTVFANMTAVIPTPENGLWLKGPSRVIQIAPEEIHAFYRDASYRVRYRGFDAVTDFVDPLTHFVPSSYGADANRSTDGLLWFTTHDGVAMIDPKNVATNRIPPPVFIRSVLTNGTRYDAYGPVFLPKSTSDLSIDYTALSLSLAERSVFRYQLIGFDKNWQDAGTRRQAFYTNLPPGKYVFRVLAANSDGVWNTQGASVEIVIPPTILQTGWFRLVELILVCLGVVILFRWRVQRVELRARNRLTERLSERSRIARELHDTLLQGFQGLILKIQAAALSIPQEEKAFTAIQDALTRADEVLAEGRDRVRDLRGEEIDTSSFEEQLRMVAESFDPHHCARFQITIDGTPRALNSLVHDEACRIAREALTNAFLHSNAQSIEVRIDFRRYYFRIVVQDSGMGIPSNILASGKDGHFGLRGMNERAQRIKAKLQIESLAHQGTTIRLTIPGRIAYAAGGGSKRKWLYE